MDYRILYRVVLACLICITVFFTHKATSSTIPYPENIPSRKLNRKSPDWSERRSGLATSETTDFSTKLPKVVRKVRLQSIQPHTSEQLQGSTLKKFNNTTKLVRIRKYRRRTTPSVPVVSTKLPSVWVTTSPHPEKLYSRFTTSSLPSTTNRPPEEFAHITVINKEMRDPKPNRKNKTKKQPSVWVPKTNFKNEAVNDILNGDKHTLERSNEPVISEDSLKVIDSVFKGKPLFLSNKENSHTKTSAVENSALEPKKQLNSNKPKDLSRQVEKLLQRNKPKPNIGPESESSFVSYVPESPELLPNSPQSQNVNVNDFSISDKDENNYSAGQGDSRLPPNTFSVYDIPIPGMPNQFDPHTATNNKTKFIEETPSLYIQNAPQQTYQNFGYQPFSGQSNVGFRGYAYGPPQQYFNPSWPQQPIPYGPYSNTRHLEEYQQPPPKPLPYTGIPEFYSPRLVSLRRSIIEGYPSEEEEHIQYDTTTEFSIPKFDIPDIDFSDKGCRTVYKEVKAVPGVGGESSESNAKSVIMERECYFPEGVPTVSPAEEDKTNKKDKIARSSET